MATVAAGCCKSEEGLQPVGTIGVNIDGPWPLLSWHRTQHMDVLEHIILHFEGI